MLVVFDGGSRGNPGPAYGSYCILKPGARPGPVRRVRFGRGTNNEAEYWTLRAALSALLESLGQDGIDPARVVLEVRGDSQLVLSQLDGSWKAKVSRLRDLRDEVRRLLDRFGAVRLVHQPRMRSVRLLGH